MASRSLSKELFWRAMEDIAGKAKLISGHKWSELKNHDRQSKL